MEPNERDFLIGLVRQELKRARKKLDRLQRKFGDETNPAHANERINFIEGVLVKLKQRKGE